jgi:hypothetical protein
MRFRLHRDKHFRCHSERSEESALSVFSKFRFFATLRMTCLTLSFLLSSNALYAQFRDSTEPPPKPIGSVLRTVREIDMTNDTIPEIMQIETTKAKRLRDSKIRFAIYSDAKSLLYEHSWKVNDFFDPKDHLPDTIKWFRLQRIMRTFFSNQNFSVCDSEAFSSLFTRVRAADIKLGTLEEQEFIATPHKVFSVFAGRNDLYGITWLDSKKKFVTLWHN